MSALHQAAYNAAEAVKEIVDTAQAIHGAGYADLLKYAFSLRIVADLAIEREPAAFEFVTSATGEILVIMSLYFNVNLRDNSPMMEPFGKDFDAMLNKAAALAR